jgi:hypothetical protein
MLFLIFIAIATAARNLDNISHGDFGVTRYDDPDFAYDCIGLNLFGYSELCNEWIEVLQQKRLADYLTPAGIDLALHYTVRRCYGLLFARVSNSKCIELINGLLLNGADPCSTVDGYTPYDIYEYYTIMYLSTNILNRLMCD